MREVRWQRKSCPERSRTGRMGCQPVVFGKQQGRRRVQRSRPMINAEIGACSAFAASFVVLYLELLSRGSGTSALDVGCWALSVEF